MSASDLVVVWDIVCVLCCPSALFIAKYQMQKVHCTSGESNSGLVRGKDLCYHYTTSAGVDAALLYLAERLP